MNQDEPTVGFAFADRHGTRRQLDTRVVFVADDDPAVTDEIASILRDNYTVRTAYDSADALASLDEDVSVAVFDPDLPGLSARRVLELATGDAVDCQVAALTEPDYQLPATAYDERIEKPVSPPELRAAVDRLSRRAAYRSTLDEYYSVADKLATFPPDDPDREQLESRMRTLQRELDDTFEDLGGHEAYEAALRELSTR